MVPVNRMYGPRPGFSRGFFFFAAANAAELKVRTIGELLPYATGKEASACNQQSVVITTGTPVFHVKTRVFSAIPAPNVKTQNASKWPIRCIMLGFTGFPHACIMYR